MKAALHAVVLLSLVGPVAGQNFATAVSPAIDTMDPAGSASADSSRFAEGARAINQNRWADAVAIFTEVAAARGDHADGALYWKAYAENKQGQGGRALDTCAELQKTYPQSRWIEDCGALSIEIRGHAGQAVQPQAEQNDDLKLLALNSLMRQDEQRALPQIEAALDGQNPAKFKERALFILSLGKSREARDLLARIAQGDAAAVRATPSLQPIAARLMNQGGGTASAAPGEPVRENNPPPPTIKTEARAVVVDVVVTKGHGEAIGNLHKQDFQIFEDGKPQTIDFFEEHTSRKLPAGAAAGLPAMPPNVYTNVPPAPEDDAVNVLLLDSLNTPSPMISYARNQIFNYLNHLKPGTRMAILCMNDKLNLVQGFTSDPAVLRDVVLKQTAPGVSLSLVSKSEISNEQELESFLNSNAPGPGGAKSGGSISNGNSPSGTSWSNPTVPMSATLAVAGAFANYQNYKQVLRTQMTLEGISDIARYLAAVPGRKNLIWFAGDFPLVILPKFDQRMEAADNGIALGQMRKTADLLTAARVAVYPVFANGMMSEDIVSADNRGAASAASVGRFPSGTGMGDYSASSDERASEISAMNQIASDTGGKAVYNTNDLDTAIGQSIADGAHYYTIVYSPTNKKMDGHFRRIEVKSDASYKLAYRHGYNADSDLFAGIKNDSDPLRSMMQRGMPNSTQVLYGVRAVPANLQPAAGAAHAGKNPKLGGPLTRYAVDFMIRWTDVRLDAQGDGRHTGKFRVELIAYDHDGRPLNWNGGTEAMDLKPEIYAAIQKSGIPAHAEIDLPAGKDVWLVTGILDAQTGKMGTLEIRIHPQSQPAH